MKYILAGSLQHHTNKSTTKKKMEYIFLCRENKYSLKNNKINMEISFSLSSKARYYSIAKIFLLSMVTVKVQVFFKKKLLHVGYNYNSKPLDTELRLLIIAAIRYITFLISTTSKNLL